MQRRYPLSISRGIDPSRAIRLMVLSLLLSGIVIGMSSCAQPHTSPSPFASAVSLIEAQQVEGIDLDQAVRYGLKGVQSNVGPDVYHEASQEAKLNGDPASMAQFEALLHCLARRTDHSLDDLMEMAIQSLAEQLEYHTAYISPAKAAQLAEMATLNGGVGVEIKKPQDWPVIAAVFSGSPAELAGLKPGDRIVEIDGQSTENWGLVQTVQKLVGRDNSKLSMTVVPSGTDTPQTVEVTRARLSSLPTVEYRPLNEHVSYISIRLLTEESSRDLAGVLAKLRQESELKAILFDLRGNTGGSLQAVREVTDQFIQEGLICWVQKGAGQSPTSCFGKDQGTEPSLPLVVFVDKKTASGGEIIAHALRAHAEAILVGQQTAGRGMVGSVFPLSNGGRIRLPVAWIGVKDGERLEGRGIQPDISTECDSDHIDAVADALAHSDRLTRSQMLQCIRESISGN